MARKSMKTGLKGKIGTGTAGFVIAAAVFGALFTAARAQEQPAGFTAMDDPSLSDSIKPAALAWSVPRADADPALADDPHLMSKDSQRYLAWAAVTGLVGSVVALFGANRLLQMLAGIGAGLGRAMGKATAKAVEMPVRAAKTAARSAARATGRVLKTPGRWLLTVASLTVFALTGVAFLDIQWEAGMLAGAGIAAASVWGWRKSGRLVSKATASLRPKPAV